MRIAIYHNLPSGGGKRALYEMTRGLAHRHEVDAYTLSCAEQAFCDLRPLTRQHNVYSFEPLPLAHRPFGRLNQTIRTIDLGRLGRLQRSVAAAIDSAGYDVVFAHQCWQSGAPQLLQDLKSASVYFCHEPPRLLAEPAIARPYTTFGRWQQLGNRVDPLPALYRSALLTQDQASARAASLVLTNSHYSRESLYRHYGLMAHVCYLGIDTALFRPLGLTRGDYVLSVGALDPHKGFDFLIRALGCLAPPRRLPLVIVSNHTVPEERVFLQCLADDLGVRVEFRSLIPDAELVQLYNQARLTLYAPVMEPFGFVPLESMACGTPVVGVREAGVRETVTDGVTGVLVERDEAIFAEAVEQLLGDPKRVEELGRSGREDVANRWTWERTVARLEGYLARAAAMGKR